jgi:tryptophan-rich sensory protein
LDKTKQGKTKGRFSIVIWFILFCAAALSISITAMIQQRRSAKEIVLFVTIFLLGFADWISIFLEQQFKPSRVIAILIGWIGL